MTETIRGNAATQTQTITCETCGRQWQRDRVRGRKPRFCEECRGEAVKAQQRASSATYYERHREEVLDRYRRNAEAIKARKAEVDEGPDVLVCEGDGGCGCTWERERRVGRKPRYCPECREKVLKAQQRDASAGYYERHREEVLAAQRVAYTRRNAEKIRARIARDAERLAYLSRG